MAFRSGPKLIWLELFFGSEIWQMWSGSSVHFVKDSSVFLIMCLGHTDLCTKKVHKSLFWLTRADKVIHLFQVVSECMTACIHKNVLSCTDKICQCADYVGCWTFVFVCGEHIRVHKTSVWVSWLQGKRFGLVECCVCEHLGLFLIIHTHMQ